MSARALCQGLGDANVSYMVPTSGFVFRGYRMFGQISWEQQYEPVGFRLTKPREATWLHIQMRLKAA